MTYVIIYPDWTRIERRVAALTPLSGEVSAPSCSNHRFWAAFTGGALVYSRHLNVTHFTLCSGRFFWQTKMFRKCGPVSLTGADASWVPGILTVALLWPHFAAAKGVMRAVYKPRDEAWVRLRGTRRDCRLCTGTYSGGC